PASNTRRLLADDIRARPRLLIVCLNQDPAVLARARQPKAAGELLAVEHERQVIGLLSMDLHRPLVPDDHGTGTACGLLVHALELTCGEREILDRHGETLDRGIERRALRHGPGTEYAADLESEVEVERGGVVELDDEPGHS